MDPVEGRPLRARRRTILLGVLLVALLGLAAVAVFRSRPANHPTLGGAASSASRTTASNPLASPPPPGTTAIVEVTSPASPGAPVTVVALAQPGATCSLSAADASAATVPTGTQPTRANAQGEAGWVWRLDPAMAPGSYRLVVSCRPGTSSTSTLIVR